MNFSSSYANNEKEKSIDHQSKFHFLENLNDHECDQCSKIFTSKYGLYYHINMHHPTQSIFCPDCNIIFRSHRTLKIHQQRFHLKNLSNYNYISSYLIVAFSTKQFSLIIKNACEQGRLPLGELTSKLFQCQFCSLSFPCSNALKYHLLNQHEQYEYNLCQTILYEIILQVEQNLRTEDDDEDIESMKFLLAKQASHFGLMNKQLARESRAIKHENNRLIFPSCQHQNRTCANLCLKYLSTYNKLIQNYPYKISTSPKGNPFIQGSIVSKLTNDSLINPSKRKFVEQEQFKTNEIKFIAIEQSSSNLTSPKINHSYTRSLSSMSSTSSTSTRSSSKNARQQMTKHRISPTKTLAVERSSEKRRRQREQRKAKTFSSSSIIKIQDDIEQENDDDEIISIKSKKPKQRQASNSSVEYVQIINNDQQSISSLNNIENLKLKSPSKNEDIIVCHSIKKSVNGAHKMNSHQTLDYDEHVRVRCKVCGDILEGRSRFSQHVLTMHSHLLKTNISDIKQQQTPVVYSV